jgi:hypothetical protein
MGQPEQDRQDRKGRSGQAEQDRQTGQAELDRQNRIGITRLPGQDYKERTARTGLCLDMADRTGLREKDSQGTIGRRG